MIEQLTLWEKAALLSGENHWESRAVERLGIPRRFFADGPHGIRRQLGDSDHLGIAGSEPATCFPTAAAIANSWDPALAEEIGTALGREAREQGVHVLLGPGLNIKRSPLGGRNFEYYSEDPLLSGTLAAATVRGIQSAGVAATPKHYAVNSQELRRMVSDSIIDERTLREIYLSAFEIVVKEGHPWAMMSSYNRVNGVYANEHTGLLSDILREEWGFDGMVVTDWGGGNDAVAGVHAGSTLEMPSPGFDSVRQIVAAVRDGQLSESDLDARVSEMLTLIERTTVTPQPLDFAEHRALARRAAAESVVLLRNENDILPLPAGHRVAVIGDFANTPRFQGAGSSQVNAIHPVSALEAIESSSLKLNGFAAGFRRDGKNDAALLRDAVELARVSETVLLYLGLPEIAESEGMDRAHLALPQNQVALLRALADVSERIVVALSAGAALETPWLHHTAAVLHGYLGGEAGAEGMLDVLTGAVNPSGRLAETFPMSLEDHPTAGKFPSTQRTAEYREGLFVGYRYFTSTNSPVAFPFGFGLSYTQFAYSDLRIEDGTAVVSVQNTGPVPGAEVVQLYVGRPSNGGVYRPRRELRGYAKLWLEPGETGIARFSLGDRIFRHFDPVSGSWQIESGVYPIEVGASSQDIRLTTTHEVSGTIAPTAAAPELRPYLHADVREVPSESFAALLRRSVPDPRWHQGDLDINDPLGRMAEARSPLARLAFRVLDRQRRKADAAGKPDLNALFLINMPFRAIAKMTFGKVGTRMVEAVLDVVNGHHVRGLARLARAAVSNAKAERRGRRQLQQAGGVSEPDRREGVR